MARTAQVVSLLYNRHFNKTKTQRSTIRSRPTRLAGTGRTRGAHAAAGRRGVRAVELGILGRYGGLDVVPRSTRDVTKRLQMSKRGKRDGLVLT